MRRECLTFLRPLKLLQVCALFLAAPALVCAQVSRAPANFVPDDDQIVVPIVIEKNMMEEFHEKHQNDFKDAKQKIRHWIAQEEYAEVYGFKNSGVVDLPTPEEKQKFFERNYLRYISKDLEKGAQNTAKGWERSAKEWYQSWDADDELAAMEAQEEKEEFIIKARKKTGGKKREIKKEVKVGESKIDFLAQPRLEMGMIKLRLKSPYINAKAWLGVNGNQEIELEREFDATRTRAKLYYFIEQQRVLASVDQHLVHNLSLRVTHDKIDGDGVGAPNGESFENNVVQLRFGMGF